jgi:hypothetical protein
MTSIPAPTPHSGEISTENIFSSYKAYRDESIRQVDIYVLFLRFSTQ